MRGSKIKINYLLRVLFVNEAYLGEREFGGGEERQIHSMQGRC